MASIDRRVIREGKVSYRARVQIRGYQSQSATFDKMSQAKQWAKRTEAAIREGRYFRTSQAHPLPNWPAAAAANAFFRAPMDPKSAFIFWANLPRGAPPPPGLMLCQ